jgi:hypothetical protein
MATLFELTAEEQMLLEMAEDPECDPQAIADTLEGIRYEFDKKSEGYCKVIRQLEADKKAFHDASQEFARKETVCDASIKRLKDALKTCMEATGKTKVDAGLYKISIAGNGGQKPLIIDGQVPEQFVKMIPQNDNEAIRRFLDSLDANDACAWAHYGERGTHLSIR